MDDLLAGTPSAAGHTNPLSMLVLTPDQHQHIVSHLRKALPNEGVALLAGPEAAPDGVVRPTRFYPGTNGLQSPVRYQMDWNELVAAIREIDRDDLRLAVIAHSHPRGPARPSATDLAEAWYPDTLMVIVSFAVDPPDLRAWALDGEERAWRPREVPVALEGHDAQAAGIAASGHIRE
jgi:proteasome lid subunit RPN8/RPN11